MGLRYRTRIAVVPSRVLASSAYERAPSKLALCLGKDTGQPIVADLARMPHLLVAGTTGQEIRGRKRRCYRFFIRRRRMRFASSWWIRRAELSVYEGIPHLLTPVVTDMKTRQRPCAGALRKWSVATASWRLGVRNMAGFNRKVQEAEKAGSPDPSESPGGVP